MPRQYRNKLTWDEVEGANAYVVVCNGEVIDSTIDTKYITETSAFYREYCVKAINDKTESFTSNVIAFYPQSTISIDAARLGKKGNIKANGFNGKGYIELSKKANTSVQSNIKVAEPGKYLVQARYSNGSGPDNTDNKCAIRTLWINGQKAGVMVMPQRGKDEWSNWGYTNLIEVELKKGKNQLQLSFEDYNNNMNGEVNTALLDEFRLIPKER